MFTIYLDLYMCDQQCRSQLGFWHFFQKTFGYPWLRL